MRIDYLKNTVDYFCIVESVFAFIGIKKKLDLRDFLLSNYGVDFVNNRTRIYENYDIIRENNLNQILNLNINTVLAKELSELAKNLKVDKYTWLYGYFQRQLIDRCASAFIDKHQLDKAQFTIIIFDVDELASLQFITSNLEPNIDVIYAEMTQFRYNLDIPDEDLWIGSVKCHYSTLLKFSINELRFALKRNATRVKKLEIQKDAGWHFTSFGSEEEIRNKMHSWGPQELNTIVNQFFIKFISRYGLDIFGRNIQYRVADHDHPPYSILDNLTRFRLQNVMKAKFVHLLLHLFIRLVDRTLYRQFQ